MNAGEKAQELVELIEEECSTLDSVGRRIVANRIEELVGPWRSGQDGKVPRPASFDPMDDLEASRFEHERVEFGKHAGDTWGSVPFSYMTWLADNSITLGRRLNRYLHNTTVKRMANMETMEEF
jgi:hypothetical protein